MTSGRSDVPGSVQPESAAFSARAKPLNPDCVLTVTIVLQPDAASAELAEQLLSGHFEPSSREARARLTGVDSETLSAVEDFARQFNLEVVDAEAAKRTVKVSGHVTDLDRAFGIELQQFGDHISYLGPVTVPTPLAPKILAVLGLDTRPAARPRNQ